MNLKETITFGTCPLRNSHLVGKLRLLVGMMGRFIWLNTLNYFYPITIYTNLIFPHPIIYHNTEMVNY